MLKSIFVDQVGQSLPVDWLRPATHYQLTTNKRSVSNLLAVAKGDPAGRPYRN